MVWDLPLLLPLILISLSQSLPLDRAHSWVAFGMGSVCVVQYNWEDLWSFLLVLGLPSWTWLKGLQGGHGEMLGPLLFPEPKQVRYNQSRPWMSLVMLHILHHPLWQRTNIPFAVSEWGLSGLKQPNTDLEAWDVPALPSPKGEGAGGCWELWQGLFPHLHAWRQGVKQQILGMGSWFCSDWYHNPRKPKLMVWVARGWGLELPFPCQWCVCCYEKPCWLFWSRCCVGGRQCSLPFLLHPLSSPTKGTPSELNFLQWLQMCLRSLPASFHHLVLFLLEISAISAAGCGNLWLQSNWEVGVPRTVQYPGLPHPLCCLQIKISNLNLNCESKGMNPLVPSCLCWCLPGCVWALSTVHLALTPLRLNDKFSLCLLLFVLFCFFSFQPSWHLILPQPVKYNPETCGWENVALCHAHLRGAN